MLHDAPGACHQGRRMGPVDPGMVPNLTARVTPVRPIYCVLLDEVIMYRITELSHGRHSSTSGPAQPNDYSVLRGGLE